MLTVCGWQVDDLFHEATVNYTERNLLRLNECWEIKAQWCEVKIHPEIKGCHLLDCKTHKVDIFRGDKWEEQLVSVVINKESASPFYFVGRPEGENVSARITRCIWADNLGELRKLVKHNQTNLSEKPLCWRGWNNRMLRCSIPFCKEYVWLT